jgi:hypothetical protein
MEVLVTVGMSAWPFDRLIRAILPLCAEHHVFAQTGTSKIIPPCPHAPFVPYAELPVRTRRRVKQNNLRPGSDSIRTGLQAAAG